MPEAAPPQPAPDSDQLQLVDRLYRAFAERDGDTMAACYSPNASFTDPVFPNLQGAQVGMMWKMLAARAKDFQLEVTDRSAMADGATVNWVAHYTFSQTGRPVVNRVSSQLRFAPDGLVGEQHDTFDFHRWARQALGAPGLLLGWAPPLRASVQRKARTGLNEFMQEHTQASAA